MTNHEKSQFGLHGESSALRTSPVWPAGLGSYLQVLGMLSASHQMDPSVRCRWEGDAIIFDHDAASFREFLLEEWKPKYRMWWPDKIDGPQALIALRNTCADDEVEILDAHAMALSHGKGLAINPVLATIGRSRNATFGKSRLQASAAVAKAKTEVRRAWIACALDGNVVRKLPEVMMTHWWWPAGQYVSPYSMLLALDGALLLSGSAMSPDIGYPCVLRRGRGRFRTLLAVPTWSADFSLAQTRQLLRWWPKQDSLLGAMIAASSDELPDGTQSVAFFGLTVTGGQLDRWMALSPQQMMEAIEGQAPK